MWLSFPLVSQVPREETFLHETKPAHVEDNAAETAFLTFSSTCCHLLLETRGKRIVDTGCTRTVCGENWYNFYLSRLDSETQKIVLRRQSNAAIVFGDGKVKAEVQAIIPITFGSDCVMLTCDVIRGDLPLLISVHTITKAKLSLISTLKPIKPWIRMNPTATASAAQVI